MRMLSRLWKAFLIISWIEQLTDGGKSETPPPMLYYDRQSDIWFHACQASASSDVSHIYFLLEYDNANIIVVVALSLFSY